MMRSLRLRLTGLYALLSALVLAAALVAGALLEARDLRQAGDESLLDAAAAVADRLAGATTLADSWLAEQEQAYECLYYLEDNGVPLEHTEKNGSAALLTCEALDRCAALGAGQSAVFGFEAADGEVWRCAALALAPANLRHGPRLLLALRSTAPLHAQLAGWRSNTPFCGRAARRCWPRRARCWPTSPCGPPPPPCASRMSSSPPQAMSFAPRSPSSRAVCRPPPRAGPPGQTAGHRERGGGALAAPHRGTAVFGRAGRPHPAPLPRRAGTGHLSSGGVGGMARAPAPERPRADAGTVGRALLPHPGGQGPDGAAFTILLHNAMEYTPPGTAIELAAGRKGAGVIFSVRDHGPGVPEKDRQRIFRRFARGEECRTGKEHFGLGLSIARQIAALHGGRLWVEDAPGGGAVFFLQLPAGR